MRVFACQPVHIGGRPAKIGDGTREAGRLVTDLLDLVQDRGFRPTLDDPPFVLGDRTESATTEAATHDVHRKTDHFEGGNSRLAVRRMRLALVG